MKQYLIAMYLFTFVGVLMILGAILFRSSIQQGTFYLLLTMGTILFFGFGALVICMNYYM